MEYGMFRLVRTLSQSTASHRLRGPGLQSAKLIPAIDDLKAWWATEEEAKRKTRREKGEVSRQENEVPETPYNFFGSW